jgi:hypothetical protein
MKKTLLFVIVLSGFVTACGEYNMAQNESQSVVQCTNNSCPSGQQCIANVCVNQTFTCGGVTCAAGQVCANNICITSSVVPLCAVPNVAVSLVCWGYPAADGTTPHVTYSVNAGSQLCCPGGLDGSFTVPTSTTGRYTGRNNSPTSRAFETLSTGAYGGQR